MSLPGLLPDLEVLRKDFPILSRTVADGQPLVYLDSANTSQKPQVVIDTMVDHLERHNANIARAMHTLGAESTEAFESARDKVAGFIGAPSRDEVIFTKNVTEGLNLLSNTFAWADDDLRVGPGDEVVITEMEHHSNIVPWQLLTERTGATLRWFGITDEGLLDLADIDELITERTKVVSLTWVSNMLGHHQPGPPDRRPGPRGGRRRDRGRRPGGAAPGGRRRRERRRLRGVHRPQVRRARPGSACSGARPTCSTGCLPSTAAAR